MKRIALAALFAVAATAGHANIGPMFLPDLTFPAPDSAPTVSSQSSQTTPTCQPTESC
ncbi:hypothetical protein [Citreimonas sp.]|uniref:hypothetical protein n=1 Tax=Citreimonas sp. TaxID=3036715 RepID=UPI00405973AD